MIEIQHCGEDLPEHQPGRISVGLEAPQQRVCHSQCMHRETQETEILRCRLVIRHIDKVLYELDEVLKAALSGYVNLEYFRR